MSSKRKLITVDEVVGAWAIVPTPAKPGAEDWRSENTVDLDEAASAVNGLIEAGIDGLLTLGTLGECATLTWDEKRDYMAAIIDAAAGRVPVFVGTTALSTRETVRQTRIAADMGAAGTMLGVPMWCAPSVDIAVQYYRDVAEACPDMGICVYDNKEAFKFEFPTAFWAQVASIPQVVTSKYSSMDRLLQDINASRGQIRFLPIDAAYYAAARMDPDFCKAFWTSGAVCGPSVAIELRDRIARAKDSGDWSEARTIAGEIGASFAPLFPNGSFKEFSMYNIGLEKARMDAAGWMKAGPVRPPYHIVPETYLEGARKSGDLWAELHKKYKSRGDA
jgi:trans-o-hydroxybenzylidenepyruvate hydratase-aldolase